MSVDLLLPIQEESVGAASSGINITTTGLKADLPLLKLTSVNPTGPSGQQQQQQPGLFGLPLPVLLVGGFLIGAGIAGLFDFGGGREG